MPMSITRREATQINTNQKKVIRRAWHSGKYMKGQKIALVLEDDAGKPGVKAPFAIEVVGIIEGELGEINDKRAQEEGFRNLSDFMIHWERMYRGTTRTQPQTRVFTMRIRKTELVHTKRNDVDSPF